MMSELTCFSCGEWVPEDQLEWVPGADNRSPRPFCAKCAGPAKKGYGGW